MAKLSPPPSLQHLVRTWRDNPERTKKVLVNAVFRFADSLVARNSRYAALERLLRREPPRLRGWSAGQPIVADGQELLAGSLAAAHATAQATQRGIRAAIRCARRGCEDDADE